MKLPIREIINTPNAIIQKFGIQVFNEVSKAIKNNPTQTIELSFEGLKNITTGFCNAAIGNLYQEFGKSLDEKLIISGIEKNKEWQRRINNAKELALNPNKAREIDAAIAELFC